MHELKKVVVAGLGEVGRPLLELISKRHRALGVDVKPFADKIGSVDILHICFPFGVRDFTGETVRYIKLFAPRLTIINSTVAVGTTRTLATLTGRAVVHSPVRGKHAHMAQDLLRYPKFVGATNVSDSRRAAEHFQSLGLTTAICSSPEATELAKLTETTYFGLMIAWAQQLERYCDQLGQEYDEVASFYDQIRFFPPVKYFPGIIGGHCVMPNIEILNQVGASDLVRAIVSSNKMKIDREAQKSVASAGAIPPTPFRAVQKHRSPRLAMR